MEKITELRNKIDAIDDQIAELINERMQTVAEIGKEKAKSGKAVADYSREKSIINRVCAKVDADKIVYTKQIFEGMFDASKAYQSGMQSASSPLLKEIESAISGTAKSFPVSATVACQGVEGAYSMLACERLFPVSDVLYFKDWNGVFTAIERGLCRYGILPIENSNAGSVYSVYDLILKHKFYIARTVRLRVRHSLLAKKGANLKNIKEIVSHRQAIDQCSEMLKKHPDITVTEVENTALAAKLVSESGRDDLAAISSSECASIYGLEQLLKDIQNVQNNYTRFICISKNMEIYPGADKISIVVALPHVTGSLNKILSKFYSLGLNLTKLESRPITASEFEFAFYFDFDGDVNKTEVKNLLCELAETSEAFSFLGSYGEVR